LAGCEAGTELGGGEPTFADVPEIEGDTVHLDVVDRWGNMVAATPSGGWLQSSPAVPGLGFNVTTRGQMFWLDERLPSALRPGARPRTTLTPTLVTREAAQAHAFIDLHRDVILKPLDGMGGSQIFRVRADDPNRNVIVEMMAEDGGRSIMAQRYIPAISEGDKRVLLIGGEAVPYSLARIPMAGETRGNLAAGGRSVAQPLSASDRRITAALGPLLAARGLLLVGLDVIGENLTEVNVTSPTCFREIMDQTGCDVAGLFVDALEAAVAARTKRA